MMQRVLVLSFSIALICFTASAHGAWIEDFESYSLGALTPQSDWASWGGGEDPTQVVLALGDLNKNAIAVAGHVGPSTDLVHSFTGYSSGQWTFSAMQYIPSSSTVGVSWFILLNRFPPPSGFYDYSYQMSFDLESGMMTVPSYDTSVDVPIVRDKWVELRFDIDLDANTFDAYYNGMLFSTRQWADLINGGQLEIQGLDLYPAADDVSVVFYDDMSLTEGIIPEPGTSLLLMVGALVGLLVWRRR